MSLPAGLGNLFQPNQPRGQLGLVELWQAGWGLSGSGSACGFSEPGAELLGLVRGCPRAAGVSATSNSSVPC